MQYAYLFVCRRACVAYRRSEDVSSTEIYNINEEYIRLHAHKLFNTLERAFGERMNGILVVHLELMPLINNI